MHCLYLLFPLGPSDTKYLVLLLNSRDFLFNFLFPIISFSLLPLATFTFEFSNLFNFSLFFNFKNGLFHRLCQKYINYGLHFSIVIEKVIVIYLGDLINASFLWDIRRSGRFRNKLVRLNLDICFIRPLFALLS